MCSTPRCARRRRGRWRLCNGFELQECFNGSCDRTALVGGWGGTGVLVLAISSVHNNHFLASLHTSLHRHNVTVARKHRSTIMTAISNKRHSSDQLLTCPRIIRLTLQEILNYSSTRHAQRNIYCGLISGPTSLLRRDIPPNVSTPRRNAE